MASKVLWNALLATPALLGAALIVSTSAMAAEVQTPEVDALLNETTDVESSVTTSELLSVSELAPLRSVLFLNKQPARLQCPVPMNCWVNQLLKLSKLKW
jgi:hypothetical protein